MNVPAGSIDANGYVGVGFRGRIYKAHRIAWLLVTGAWPASELDHINMCRRDNRWSNLRLATRSQNQRNSRRYKNNTSGHKGVSWHPQHKQWYATIQINNKVVFLGLFTNKKKAGNAYRAAAKKYHGEFARF